MKEINIKISGMVCEGCEKRVQNALTTIEGVTEVEASHKTGKVIVKTNKEIENKIIEDKIDDLGFEIVKED